MSNPICLSKVPSKFLDQRKWKSLRRSASKEIIALTCINAPYPDEEHPSDFFWGRRDSAAAAIRCYRTGRLLLEECRALLLEGKLVATGVEKRTKGRKTISAKEWINLWPMFATNKATGPHSDYSEVKIYEATSSNTPHEKMVSDCIDWLKGRLIAGDDLKKTSLYTDARRALGRSLTHAIFDAAYLVAYGRQRGRPKNIIHSKV